MKAAILNPGPSLSLYRGRGDYDLVVGVNRAATAHPCDTWLALDTPCVRAHHPSVIGSPLLVTGIESYGSLAIDVPRYRGEIIDHGRYHDFAPTQWSWQSFSALSAVVYTAWRGATSIDVYGADWSGTLDFDGVAAGGNRSEARWEWERGIFLNLLTPWLRERGIAVRRLVRPVYASFYTPIYAAEASGLIETLDRFGLEHDVRQWASQGSWVRNCAAKPDFLLEMRRAHPGRPLVWVDADARIRKYPELLDSLECDFAAHWRDGHELLSGTLFFGSSRAADRLLRDWAAMCGKHPETWDQKSLEAVVNAMPELKVQRLPAPYTLIFDSMAHQGEPVIEHTQASRRLREVAQ